jgi:hypothetical protein
MTTAKGHFYQHVMSIFCANRFTLIFFRLQSAWSKSRNRFLFCAFEDSGTKLLVKLKGTFCTEFSTLVFWSNELVKLTSRLTKSPRKVAYLENGVVKSFWSNPQNNSPSHMKSIARELVALKVQYTPVFYFFAFMVTMFPSLTLFCTTLG